MLNSKPLVIIGASGHGRVISDLCHAAGLEFAGFLDDGLETGTVVAGQPLLGGRACLQDHDFVAAHRFLVGIGDCTVRRKLSLDVKTHGGELATLIHPRAVLAADVSVGAGSVVMAGAVINTGTRIGDFCVINTAAILDHDNLIEDGVHISPGCVLAGTVICREDCFVGTGAIIIPRVEVGTRAVVGAGATVIHDVEPNCMVAGCPATVKKRYLRPG